MYHQFKNGFVELICGCRFSGKTQELLRRVSVLSYGNHNVQVFSINKLNVEDKPRINFYQVKDSKVILKLIKADVNVVAIDQVEEFDQGIISLIEYLADKGIRVIVGGTDLDCFNEPYYITGNLLARAEFISKLTAVCVCCGAPATRTQMISNDKPVKQGQDFDLKTVIYQPRCRHCHEV